MPKGDRPGIITNDPQPGRELADGFSAGQGQHGRREAHEPRDGEQQHDGGPERFINAGHQQRPRDEDDIEQGFDDDQVEQPGEDPQPDRGRWQIERDGFAGDEVVFGHADRRDHRFAHTAYSSRVDLDAYVAAHSHEWSRLEALLGRRGKLGGAEADELLDLYQRTATHLSEIRSTAPEPSIVAYLSSMLARARSRSVGSRSTSWNDVVTFFVATFPAALYRTRRWWLITMAINVAVAFVIGWWFYVNPQFESALASPAEIEQLVTHDFQDYYSEYAAGSFAARVWTNNAWVTALCISFGVLGVPVVWLLWNNIVNVAVIGAIMWRYDRAALFFGLILPHGMLELTAVFVAAGVGLRIFWAWVEPGPRTRMSAIAHEGRAAMSVALGLVVVLFISGVLEAFITPSPLPTWARICVGALAEAGFFIYVFTLGRYAVRRGETGDVAAADQGDTAPMVS